MIHKTKINWREIIWICPHCNKQQPIENKIHCTNCGYIATKIDKKNKKMNIIINGREKEYNNKTINYQQAVILAFSEIDLARYKHKVTYTRDTNPPFEEHGELLLDSGSVRVMRDMRFNVTCEWNG